MHARSQSFFFTKWHDYASEFDRYVQQRFGKTKYSEGILRADGGNGKYRGEYEIAGITLTACDNPYTHFEALARNMNNLMLDGAKLLGVEFAGMYAKTVDDVYTAFYNENMKREAYEKQSKK